MTDRQPYAGDELNSLACGVYRNHTVFVSQRHIHIRHAGIVGAAKISLLKCVADIVGHYIKAKLIKVFVFAVA